MNTSLMIVPRKPAQRARCLKALAVTPDKRTWLAPQLPTVSEASGLPDFGVTAWMGIFGPASMPANITERLSSEVVKTLANPALQEKFVSIGVEPAPAGPAEFGGFVKDQLAVWQRQIGLAGMKPE